MPISPKPNEYPNIATAMEMRAHIAALEAENAKLKEALEKIRACTSQHRGATQALKIIHAILT